MYILKDKIKQIKIKSAPWAILVWNWTPGRDFRGWHRSGTISARLIRAQQAAHVSGL